MSSPSPSGAGIIERCIAHATSARGGSKPVLIRSRSPAGSGKRRTEWNGGGLNDQRYLVCVAQPALLTQPQTTRTSAPPQRRRKNPAYRILPVSRISAAGCSRIPTMWRPSEPAEEEISDLSGFDPQSKRRRSRRCAWRDGLADQTVITTLEHVRSYRAFERAVVGGIDPRSVIELALAH